MSEPTEFVSAERFLETPGLHWHCRIPFSPVVGKYGRIMVGLEPAIDTGIIKHLYLWFDCHEIPGLEKPFAIPTPQATDSTGIITFNFQTAGYGSCACERSGTASFFASVWRIAPCGEHGTLAFLSYPPDDAVALIVDTLTSTLSIHYELRARPPEARSK